MRCGGHFANDISVTLPESWIRLCCVQHIECFLADTKPKKDRYQQQRNQTGMLMARIFWYLQPRSPLHLRIYLKMGEMMLSKCHIPVSREIWRGSTDRHQTPRTAVQPSSDHLIPVAALCQFLPHLEIAGCIENNAWKFPALEWREAINYTVLALVSNHGKNVSS